MWGITFFLLLCISFGHLLVLCCVFVNFDFAKTKAKRGEKARNSLLIKFPPFGFCKSCWQIYFKLWGRGHLRFLDWLKLYVCSQNENRWSLGNCQRNKKSVCVPPPPSQEILRLSETRFILLRSRGQLQKPKLSSHSSFGFLLMEWRRIGLLEAAASSESPRGLCKAGGLEHALRPPLPRGPALAPPPLRPPPVGLALLVCCGFLTTKHV